MECLAVNQQRFASVIDNINKELNQKGESSTAAMLKKDLTLLECIFISLFISLCVCCVSCPFSWCLVQYFEDQW